MSNLLQVRWFFNKKLDLEIQYKIGLSFFRILKYNNEIQMTFTPKLTPRTFLFNPLSANPQNGQTHSNKYLVNCRRIV